MPFQEWARVRFLYLPCCFFFVEKFQKQCILVVVTDKESQSVFEAVMKIEEEIEMKEFCCDNMRKLDNWDIDYLVFPCGTWTEVIHSGYPSASVSVFFCPFCGEKIKEEES